MAYKIPDELISQIEKSVDVVDVVSEYVQLKKQGRNYFGLCPFHGENTPSFSVSSDKQIYHCFGCGAGGNVFSFLMQIEGYTFVESAKKLAEVANIELPDEVSQMSNHAGHTDKQSQYYQIYDLLRKFYHHLLKNTKEGQEALDYLLDRGFTNDIIDKFEIGYAIDSWDFIKKYCLNKGYNEELLYETGIVVKRESDGSFFDRFRNRIMFPIKDHQGRTVAFSGRSIGASQPKYLNSPETKLFNKRTILYNFHQARVHIRKSQQVVIYEGFADVISSVRAQVENAVATMGTSLTEEQAKLIKRNVETAIICYDSDQAGIEATFRAVKVLEKYGCRTKIARVPDGLDPDDYINKYGTEKFFNDVIGASVTTMVFKIEYFRKGKNLKDEGDRLKYIEEVLEELSQITNAVEQDLYLSQLASEFSLSKHVLQGQLEKYIEKRPKNVDQVMEKQFMQPMIQSNSLLPAYQNAEKFLIAHMIRNSDVAEKVLDHLGGDFIIEEHRAIVSYIYAFYEEGNEPNISLLIQKLPHSSLRQTVSNIAMLSITDDISDKEIDDYIKAINDKKQSQKWKEKEFLRVEAERQKDYEKAAIIAKEILELKKACR
ncbi:DNA primase [Bacillus carboniphilus]|uniref:DNA primase n=1 Tax=Bacillus carboniphilus TaxID=86663 RepID=A0ABY9JX68_9BACI|nr:DNA primase [Bacillus carboniphilus]WLR43974.1 DNA primase [Bacillus carboniphilus]